VLTDALLEPLVAGSIEGNPQSWQELVAVVHPEIERMAGRWRWIARPEELEDACCDIALAVVDRLHAEDFRRLRLLHAVLVRRCGDGVPWLAVMARNTAFNYRRDHPENLRPEDPGEVPLDSLPEGVEDTLPESVRIVRVVHAHEIMAFAERVLSPAQLQALHEWQVDEEYAEIAKHLGLRDAQAAELLVRSALWVLRRRNRKEEEP
jgi:hypothetical protein